MGYFFGIVFIIILVLVFRSAVKTKRFLKEFDIKFQTSVQHIEGLPLPEYQQATLFANHERLLIESKKGRFEIPNERIINYEKVENEEIIENEYEMKTKTREYLVIHYINQEGRTKFIMFESQFNTDYIVRRLTELLGRTEAEPDSIQHDPNTTITL